MWKTLAILGLWGCSGAYPECQTSWVQCHTASDVVLCNTFFEKQAELSSSADGAPFLPLAHDDPEVLAALRIHVRSWPRNVYVTMAGDIEMGVAEFYCNGPPPRSTDQGTTINTSACGIDDLTACQLTPTSLSHPHYVDPDLHITNDEAVLLYTDALDRRIRVAWAFCGGTLPDASAFQCPE